MSVLYEGGLYQCVVGRGALLVCCRKGSSTSVLWEEELYRCVVGRGALPECCRKPTLTSAGL